MTSDVADDRDTHAFATTLDRMRRVLLITPSSQLILVTALE